ncbi:PadR family transcriptional regulator [Akkermansiaceae bacterium]|nr:PadR family transcriptional regulator [Akkermansiaceae bacterium]
MVSTIGQCSFGRGFWSSASFPPSPGKKRATATSWLKKLVNAPGLDASEGSIYPLLSRMRKQGLIQSRLEESDAGPARKYYRLTAAGKARGLAMQSYYDGLTDAVQTLRSPSKPKK